MDHRDLILYALTFAFEIPLCVLVYFRGLQRRLPFFAAHATLLVVGTLGIQLVYRLWGFNSLASYNAYWIIAGLIVVARGLAVAELCRYEFRAYQVNMDSSPALIDRISSPLSLVHAGLDAWGQLDRIAIYGLTLERDIEISAVVILVAMLIIRSYYGIKLETAAKTDRGRYDFLVHDRRSKQYRASECIHRAALILVSYGLHVSMAGNKTTSRERKTHGTDQFVTLGLVISISVWCYAALRKPLPAPAPEPMLLPAEVYGELSPAINLRLRTFNDRLLELLKS